MSRNKSIIQGILVTAVSMAILVVSVIAGTRGEKGPVEFTLVAASEPALIPFSLVPPASGPSAGAGLGVLEMREDPGSPYWTTLGAGSCDPMMCHGIGLTAVGFEALRRSEAGDYNTATGYHAIWFTFGSYNTATGAFAGGKGSYNTAAGAFACCSDSTQSSWNTAVGYNALFLPSNSSENVALGANTLTNLVWGVGNVAIGNGALECPERRGGANFENNIAIGYKAGSAILEDAAPPVRCNILIGAGQTGVVGDPLIPLRTAPSGSRSRAD